MAGAAIPRSNRRPARRLNTSSTSREAPKLKSFKADDAERAKVSLAPQAAVAKQVQPILDALDDENWEDSFCRMLAVMRADTAMDPILRMNLLQRVLKAGSQGSYCLEKAFDGHVQWFREAKIDVLANWLDPDDKQAAQTRRAAETCLQSFPEIGEPRKRAMDDLAACPPRRAHRVPLDRLAAPRQG